MQETMKTLYFLSKEPVELLIPKESNADNAAPFVRLSGSIPGYLYMLQENVSNEQFYVYSITTDEYFIPTLAEAPNKHLTEELRVNFAFTPDYLYTIKVKEQSTPIMENFNGQMSLLPQWDIEIIEDKKLTEDTRVVLVNKSKGAGPYKNQMRGKNRFERKKHSQIAKTVKQYNKIDMNKVFKEDILEVSIPVIGETDSYTVNIRLEGVVKEIAKNIKNNQNKLEYKTIVQSLTKIFNSGNVWVKCSCPDYKYRFAHWNIVNRVSVDDTSKDPGPGKGIANPNDDKGRGCKHVLLCLANGDWVMKVSSVINNYIHYAEEKLQKPFLKLIFPKLYGVPYDEAVENNLLPDDFELDSSESIIDAINDWGKNRGKMKKGSNINPVYANKLSAEQKKKSANEVKPEEPKNKSKSPEKQKEATTPMEKEKASEAEKTKPEQTSKPVEDKANVTGKTPNKPDNEDKTDKEKK